MVLNLVICADTPVVREEKNLATWGTETSEDLVLDPKLLKEAIKRVLFAIKIFLHIPVL